MTQFSYLGIPPERWGRLEVQGSLLPPPPLLAFNLRTTDAHSTGAASPRRGEREELHLLNFCPLSKEKGGKESWAVLQQRGCCHPGAIYPGHRLTREAGTPGRFADKPFRLHFSSLGLISQPRCRGWRLRARGEAGFLASKSHATPPPPNCLWLCGYPLLEDGVLG